MSVWLNQRENGDEKERLERGCTWINLRYAMSPVAYSLAVAFSSRSYSETVPCPRGGKINDGVDDVVFAPGDIISAELQGTTSPEIRTLWCFGVQLIIEWNWITKSLQIKGSCIFTIVTLRHVHLQTLLQSTAMTVWWTEGVGRFIGFWTSKQRVKWEEYSILFNMKFTSLVYALNEFSSKALMPS